MMAIGKIPKSISDIRGAAAIEFGLLAPVMIAMLMGVLWVGLQMKSYNALRSISADVSRYTVVEYQKSNKISPEQISEVAASMAVRQPYTLAGESLDIFVSEQASPMAGTRAFSLRFVYSAPNFLEFIGVGAPRMTYNQTVFVPV